MRGLFSPVPTQTMLRSDGATHTSPMRDGGLAVELMLEGDAVVDRLEQAAGGGGDPVGGGVGLEDGEGDDASAHRGRADAAPVQRLDPVGRQGCRRGQPVRGLAPAAPAGRRASSSARRPSAGPSWYCFLRLGDLLSARDGSSDCPGRAARPAKASGRNAKRARRNDNRRIGITVHLGAGAGVGEVQGVRKRRWGPTPVLRG